MSNDSEVLNRLVFLRVDPSVIEHVNMTGGFGHRTYVAALSAGSRNFHNHDMSVKQYKILRRRLIDQVTRDHGSSFSFTCSSLLKPAFMSGLFVELRVFPLPSLTHMWN